MSQKSRILSYMKLGKPITPITALRKFGCFRLAARIMELREDGHNIHCEILPVGEKRVGYYTLLEVKK